LEVDFSIDGETGNYIGRPTQGNLPQNNTGTEKMHFLSHKSQPTGKRHTYLRVVAKVRPEEAESTSPLAATLAATSTISHRHETLEVPAPTQSTSKCLFNSVLSTPNANP
jgi:hypothetical protein